MKKSSILGKIFATLLLLLLILFLNGRVSSSAQKVAKSRGELEALRQKNATLQKVQAEFAKIEPDVDKVLAILPDNKSFVDFLSFLEGEASASGLEIKFDFEEKKVPTSQTPVTSTESARLPSPGGEATGGQAITFSMELSGGGGALASFWRKLEQGPYFINIQNIDFNTPDGLDGGGDIKLKVKLYVDASFQA